MVSKSSAIAETVMTIAFIEPIISGVLDAILNDNSINQKIASRDQAISYLNDQLSKLGTSYNEVVEGRTSALNSLLSVMSGLNPVGYASKKLNDVTSKLQNQLKGKREDYYSKVREHNEQLAKLNQERAELTKKDATQPRGVINRLFTPEGLKETANQVGSKVSSLFQIK